MNYYAGIEGGGTKFKVIIANNPRHIVAEASFPTRDPDNTLAEVISFLHTFQLTSSIQLRGIGLACFGPLELDARSPNYGNITTTPKLLWQNFPILEFFRAHLNLPVWINTDVNAAALAEGRWGAARGLAEYAYITVGTGIGGGLIHNKRPIIGMTHPEIGHMRVTRALDDQFAGNCPSHLDCLEGLASAPAIEDRWDSDPVDLDQDHPAWNLEAYYLGQMVYNLAITYSPKRVILGGGVMKSNGLIEKVREHFKLQMSSYIQSSYLENLNEYIVPPSLGDLAGALGAVALIKKYS